MRLAPSPTNPSPLPGACARSPPVLPVLAALRRISFQHSAALAVYISLPPALGAPPTPVNGSGGGWKLGEARLRQNIPAVAAWNGNPAREASYSSSSSSPVPPSQVPPPLQPPQEGCNFGPDLQAAAGQMSHPPKETLLQIHGKSHLCFPHCLFVTCADASD